MIGIYLFQNLNGIDPVFWFQQNGARTQADIQVFELLKEKFGYDLIQKNGPIHLPHRLCDITVIVYFFGVISSHCFMLYADKQKIIDAFQTNLTSFIDGIRSGLLEKVIQINMVIQF